jgi:hypothetical protein
VKIKISKNSHKTLVAVCERRVGHWDGGRLGGWGGRLGRDSEEGGVVRRLGQLGVSRCEVVRGGGREGEQTCERDDQWW